MSPRSRCQDRSSFGTLFLVAGPNTEEAISAFSRIAQEMDEAMSQASWTALVKDKERDWWSIDLEQ